MWLKFLHEIFYNSQCKKFYRIATLGIVIIEKSELAIILCSVIFFSEYSKQVSKKSKVCLFWFTHAYYRECLKKSCRLCFIKSSIKSFLVKQNAIFMQARSRFAGMDITQTFHRNDHNKKVLLKRPIQVRQDKTSHINSPSVEVYEKSYPNQHWLAQGQKLKHKSNVCNNVMALFWCVHCFHIVNIYHTYFRCLHFWLWTSKYQLAYCLRDFLFSIWVFFHNHSRITGLQGKGERISLTHHYHFHPLHRHLDICRAITVESTHIHIGSSRNRTGNLWFPSASH